MNKNILNLKIFTINKLFIEEIIKKITIFGKEDCFTILPKHQDYISSFSDGYLFYVDNQNETKYVGINQGIIVKTGKELEIITFNAIKGDNSLEKLKNIITDNFKKVEELLEIEKKIKKSLTNIEVELFQKLLKLNKN